MPAITTVKQPLKLLDWGMVSSRGLSERHEVQLAQTLAADYYTSEVLETTADTTRQQKKEMGHQPVTLLPGMPRNILQQDVASAHRARKDQDWCRFQGFWEKGA